MNNRVTMANVVPEIERRIKKVEDLALLPEKPLISVCIATYNHERFISQAIEGALKQKTNFSYEIIVGDDHSTDNTASIVSKYQKKYPEKVRARLAKENLHSIKLRWNSHGIRSAARGKYIALCQGDDYWTDSHKLQKQVDFLEAQPEFVMTHHDAKIITSTGQLIEKSQLPNNNKRDFSRREVMEGPFLLTLSLCYRNVLDYFPPEYFNVLNGDKFLISLLGQHGKAAYQSEIAPAGYRAHDGGIWTGLDNLHQNEALANSYDHLITYYKRRSAYDVASNYQEKSFKLRQKLYFQYIKAGRYSDAMLAYFRILKHCARNVQIKDGLTFSAKASRFGLGSVRQKLKQA